MGPSSLKITSGGALQLPVKQKLAFHVANVRELCEPSGYRTKDYECVYETAKLSGHVLLPGDLTAPVDGSAKLNKARSDASCATTLPYEAALKVYYHSSYGVGKLGARPRSTRRARRLSPVMVIV